MCSGGEVVDRKFDGIFERQKEREQKRKGFFLHKDSNFSSPLLCLFDWFPSPNYYSLSFELNPFLFFLTPPQSHLLQLLVYVTTSSFFYGPDFIFFVWQCVLNYITTPHYITSRFLLFYLNYKIDQFQPKKNLLGSSYNF